MAEFIAMLAGVVVLKITAMIVGYKIVKLGYDALVKGVKGDFDFGGKVVDRAELRLLSASPGLFFVLFGSIVIVWSIAVDKPISFTKEMPAPVSHVTPEPMLMEPAK